MAAWAALARSANSASGNVGVCSRESFSPMAGIEDRGGTTTALPTSVFAEEDASSEETDGSQGSVFRVCGFFITLMKHRSFQNAVRPGQNLAASI